jgi:hypothetical protein
LQRLPFLLERILSLGFDVISNVLETGPVGYFNYIHMQFILISVSIVRIL